VFNYKTVENSFLGKLYEEFECFQKSFLIKWIDNTVGIRYISRYILYYTSKKHRLDLLNFRILLHFARRIGYCIPKTKSRISTESYYMVYGRAKGVFRGEGNKTRIYRIPHSYPLVLYNVYLLWAYSNDDE